MKFGHVELFVSQPNFSRDFYINILGFTETTKVNDELIWIALDDFEILLKRGDPQKTQNYQSASQGLVLYTKNLEDEKRKLKNRGLIFQGTDGNEKCLTFTDPDGHWFQLVNPHDH